MRSILITGGTGTFGRAFVTRLLRETLDDVAANFYFDRICIFSRGEHAQAAMRAEFHDSPRLRWFIGDVRDRDRLRRAMEGVGVVVHAAALKRIEVGHYNPIEMVRTNVGGAVNVIEAAKDAPGEIGSVSRRVVFLSSDKAYAPVSAYGYSKALAESLFLAEQPRDFGPRFAVTRYGNVAGSAGSVIPRWRAMIAEGATEVPVTDPECTRFWMSVEQATSLVRHTILNMEGGELVIPELPAFRLADLAAAMGVGMRVTGLGNWEKKHESMREGLSSDTARRMTVDEIKRRLASDA